MQVRWFVSLCLLLMLGGCVGLSAPVPVQLYEGGAKAQDQESVVGLGGGLGNDVVCNVQSIDEQNLWTGSTHRPTKGYHILPGSHVIDVAYSNFKDLRAGRVVGYTNETGRGTANIESVAGHSYIPRCLREGDSVRVWLEDKGENYPQDCLAEEKYGEVVNGTASGC